MPRRTKIDALADRLAELLAARGMTAAHEDLVAELTARRDLVAASLHIQPSSAMPYLTEDLLVQMADAAVADLAEERPGEDPWSREPNISLPVDLSSRLCWALLIVARCALASGDQHVADNAVAAAGGYAQQASQFAVLTGDQRYPVMVKVPQEALAFTARMLEVGGESLREGKWRMPAREVSDPVGIAERMLGDARLARRFVDRWGTDRR